MTTYFSPEMKWQTFKKLYDASMGDDTGPIPMHMDRVLWFLLREKKVYIGYSPRLKDLFVSVKKPKGKITVIV